MFEINIRHTHTHTHTREREERESMDGIIIIFFCSRVGRIMLD